MPPPMINSFLGIDSSASASVESQILLSSGAKGRENGGDYCMLKGDGGLLTVVGNRQSVVVDKSPSSFETRHLSGAAKFVEAAGKLFYYRRFLGL
jgi:hypothetical protein